MINKAWKNKDLFLQAFYMLLTAVMVALVMLVNWVDATFEWERLFNSAYWFQYALTLFVALVGFFLTIQGQKIKLKGSNEIKDELSQIEVYFDYISGNSGLYTKMKVWIERQNFEKKKRLYIIALKQKREKLKREEEIDAIDKKIERADEDVDYVDIKFIPKSINLLFSGFKTKDEDELLVYTGFEKMGEYLIPAIVSSLVFTVLMLTFVLSPATSTIDKIVQLVARLFCIGSYIWKAIGYARYSIMERYKATLEQRKAVIKSFFDEIGETVEIQNNPCYKYRVVKEQKESTEV